MKKSIKAMLEKAIDYAGLFPPAGLSIEDALANYNVYRHNQESWMLSRFICPTTKFSEFEEVYLGLINNEEESYSISALCGKPEKPDQFIKCFNEETNAINCFVKSNNGKIIVDVLEMCLPLGIASDSDGFINALAGELKTNSFKNIGGNPTQVYFEATLNSDWQDELKSVINVIAGFNNKHLSPSLSERKTIIGFKFRCGGVKAEQYPSIEQTAYCVKLCAEMNVPLKLTAGLHHPFRHFNENAQTKMHGFFNIFAAALLCHKHNLDENALIKIIGDEDRGSFIFEENEFAWKNQRISVDEITKGRKTSIISFGCCSFEEPKYDLQKAGLL